MSTSMFEHLDKLPKLFWLLNFLQKLFSRPNFEHCLHNVSHVSDTFKASKDP